EEGKPVVLMVELFPDSDFEGTLRRIERLGLGEVVGSREGGRFHRLRLLTSPAALSEKRSELAGIDDVAWIDVEPRRVLLNDTTVWVAQSGLAGGGATPIFDQGIFGEGQTVAILDTGIDADMCYFRDPTRGLPPRNECNGGTVTDPAQRKVVAVDFLWGSECAGGISNTEWDTQDHGSHVAGTVAGDDLAAILTHNAGDGMAPGAKLVIQDGGFATDNCADLPGIGCPVVDLNPIFQQAYSQGARIHTNSWGDEENNPVKGRYTAGSQDADEFMWNHKDFLLVFAAGNDGPGTGSIGSPSTAKSVVSVGATLRASSANSMASFSSCGPTQDGRIKPDVTMPGSSIISANADNNIASNNCNTKSSSGTSMAAPGAAGSAALIRQYFTDGWYPSGSPVPADAFTPSAALLKATLMSSAINMTGTASIPGNCQGWGRVLLEDALFFSGQSRELFVEDDATGFASGSSGESRTFNFTVSGGEPLKATLAWTDFPAATLASPTLVNDLDLIVTGPGGIFRGNVFSGGSSTTGGTADRLNTVEQVLIANPSAGSYTVEVRSFTVPSGPQPFALVVTGALSAPCSPAPVADAGPDQTIPAGGSATLGTAALPGHTYSWSPGGQTTAQITVSPAATTTYTLTATTACGSANDSVTVTVNQTGCSAEVDFEAGAAGWINSGASTCSTGTFVVGTPTSVVNGGVTTQLAGDHTTGTGNAFFSATNSSAGVNDVDGGNCIVESPVYSVADASDVSIWYFHGQRDASGDSGDFFRLEISTNGGSTWSTLASFGDQTVNAAWTEATASVPAGSQVKLRVQASDGTANGDLVEAGVDDLSICPSGGGGNTPPQVTISAPANGSTFVAGQSVTFGGSATDAEDGTLSGSLSWTSSLDGAIGSGAGFSTSTLSVGTHTVTASVVDSGGLPASDSITVTITNPGGACAAEEDFSGGAGGWTNSPSSTCSTGSFVVGTPTTVVDGGVTTQVGGDHTSGSGAAFFTATNTSAGVNDVDGGNCIAESPSYAVSEASSLSIWFFHGQRDPGDDPSGDFFRLELSINGGTTWSTLTSFGDQTVNAAWTEATASIPAGSTVRLRVQASDGAGPGDLVEGGVDDLTICPTGP
ncbi:MAG: S8 family serine peptidase, partial [Acidobacteria bacterium]|nr:S8 family serine peptidase [Acidobacteriota bacterium]